MGIFSNWGKNKTTDTDPQETAEAAEKAKAEINAERQAFLDRIRVDVPTRPVVDNSSGNPDSKPDAPDDPERNVDDELPRGDDDENIR